MIASFGVQRPSTPHMRCWPFYSSPPCMHRAMIDRDGRCCQHTQRLLSSQPDVVARPLAQGMIMHVASRPAAAAGPGPNNPHYLASASLDNQQARRRWQEKDAPTNGGKGGSHAMRFIAGSTMDPSVLLTRVKKGSYMTRLGPDRAAAC